jgi:hypothetical protein
VVLAVLAALAAAFFLFWRLRSTDEANVHEVPASIAADCSRPVDQDVNRFIAGVPDHSEVRFRRNGCYGHDGTFTVTDRRGITIDGNGSTFKALTPGTDIRAHWRALGGADITFKNMTVQGVHPPYDNPRIGRESGNHAQHGFSFESVQGGALLDSRALDVDGDPVSFEPDPRRGSFCLVPPARNIVVDRFHGFNAARTVALTHADGITIQNSYFGDIYDNAIDIETDTECEWSRNIRILNNRFGRHHFALLSYVGSEPADRSGGLEFSGNVSEVPPTSCFPAIYFEPSWQSPERAAFYRGSTTRNRNNVVIRRNTLNTAGDGIKVDNAGDARIEDNVVTSWSRGACGNAAAGGDNYIVALSDSDRVNVHGNRGMTAPGSEAFAGQMWTDPACTDVTQLPPGQVPPPGPLPAAPADGDKETIPPEVALLEPPQGATVSGTVRFLPRARDRNATELSPPVDAYGVVKHLEYQLDGVSVGVDRGDTYSYSWDSSGASAGPHTFTVTAVDSNDNRASASVTVNVTGPP